MSKQFRVLLIDDMELMHLFYASALEKSHIFMEIRKAFNGGDGLRLLQSFRPDFIIVDCHMPVMDGVEFCATARARSYTGPIIMVTSEERSRLRDDLRKSDAYYLQKPVDMSDSFLCRRFDNSLLEFVRGFVARTA